MVISTSDEQYVLNSPFEYYFQILFYLVMIFVIFLVSRNSEDWFSFKFFLIIIPGIVIKVISLIFFSKKISISDEAISSTSFSGEIVLPGEMIQKVKYKPGGYGKGITIPGTIILSGENDSKRIFIHSFIKNFKDFEEKLINLLNKHTVTDYPKVKEEAVKAQVFALIPREFVLEILTYTLITICSIYICIGVIIK